MEIKDDILQVLKGERFSQIMTGFEFTAATQIIVLIYDRESEEDSEFSLSFVKTADAEYPDAGLITLNEDNKMVFTIDTEEMEISSYDIEVRVDIAGVNAPILKKRKYFLTINESRT